MEELTIRILPWRVGDGAWNMAADETMMESAAQGRAGLRFYGWSPATLLLGYFQRAAERMRDARLSGLPWVRRLTGGGALVHDREVTYALALPAEQAWLGRNRPGSHWIQFMHGLIAAVLCQNQVAAASLPLARSSDDYLCFQNVTSMDVTIGPHKVAGSAQRRHRGALLQHGGILLARSPFTPDLPGIEELAGRALERSTLTEAIIKAFAARTGAAEIQSDWTSEELQRIEQLREAKYGQPAWNARR